MAKREGTKIITDSVRMSYLHVFEPHKFNEKDELKYYATLLIDKTDTKLIKMIEEAIEEAKQTGITSEWGGKLPRKLHNPLRDGDEEREDDAAFAGMMFINAKSKTKPGIIDRFNKKLESDDDFYSGCYGRGSITFFPFSNSGTEGVGVALNNLMKLEDGERLAGGASAEADFGEYIEEGGDEDFLG